MEHSVVEPKSGQEFEQVGVQIGVQVGVQVGVPFQNKIGLHLLQLRAERDRLLLVSVTTCIIVT
jgi:hypothetical protein